MKNFILNKIEETKKVLENIELAENLVTFYKSKVKVFEDVLEAIDNPNLESIVEIANALVKVELDYGMNDMFLLKGKLEAFDEVLGFMKKD